MSRVQSDMADVPQFQWATTQDSVDKYAALSGITAPAQALPTNWVGFFEWFVTNLEIFSEYLFIFQSCVAEIKLAGNVMLHAVKSNVRTELRNHRAFRVFIHGWFICFIHLD